MRRLHLVVVILLCVGLVGCASPAASPTPPPPTEAPPATATQPPPTDTPAPTATEAPTPTNTAPAPFPAGTYKAASPVHTREIRFLGDGSYRQLAGALTISGKYTLDGDKVTFQEDKGFLLCTDLPGTYSWTFDGKTLTLTAVDEKCSTKGTANDRQDFGGQWVLQP